MKSKKTLSKLLAVAGISLFFLNACSSAPTQSAEDVIGKFKTQVKEVKSVDMSVDVSMTGEDAGDNIGFNLEADVKLDRQDQTDRKADVDVKLDGSLNAGDQSMDGKAHLKLISIGEELYFNINEFRSTDPNTKSFESLLEPYLKQWQHLSSDFIPEDIKKLQKKDEETLKKEAELKELFINTKLFEVTKEFGVEKLNGKKVYHYGVKLDKEGVKEYVKKASTINGRELTTDEVEEASVFADSVSNMELYIGEKDYFLYKAVVELSGTSPEDGVTTNISLNYVASSYNQDLKIAIPNEYEEFNPLSLLMGLQLGGSGGLLGEPADDLKGEGLDELTEGEGVEESLESTTE